MYWLVWAPDAEVVAYESSVARMFCPFDQVVPLPDVDALVQSLFSCVQPPGGVRLGVGVIVAVGVIVGVAVGVAVAVKVGVWVGVAVLVAVGVWVGVAVLVAVFWTG
jgi:hypothetical protein